MEATLVLVHFLVVSREYYCNLLYLQVFPFMQLIQNEAARLSKLCSFHILPVVACIKFRTLIAYKAKNGSAHTNYL